MFTIADTTILSFSPPHLILKNSYFISKQPSSVLSFTKMNQKFCFLMRPSFTDPSLLNLVSPFVSQWVPTLGSKHQTTFIAEDPAADVLDRDLTFSISPPPPMPSLTVYILQDTVTL